MGGQSLTKIVHLVQLASINLLSVKQTVPCASIASQGNTAQSGVWHLVLLALQAHGHQVSNPLLAIFVQMVSGLFRMVRCTAQIVHRAMVAASVWVEPLPVCQSIS